MSNSYKLRALSSLQRYLHNGQDHTTAAKASWDQPKLLSYYAVGLLTLITFFYFVLREYLYHLCGLEWYPPRGMCICINQSQRRQVEQVGGERTNETMEQHHVAVVADREHNEKIIQQRRLELRSKLAQFLAPYTMVVKSEDFLYASQTPDGGRQMNLLKAHQPPDAASNGEEHVVNKTEIGRVDAHGGDEHVVNMTEIDCVDAHGSDELMIKIEDASTGLSRYASGFCSICLLDYEVGVSVIRSSQKDCCHIFHDECILSWLAQGKKRCPHCRTVFVPSSIFDKKNVINDDERDIEASTIDSDAVLYDNHVSQTSIDPLAAVQDDGSGSIQQALSVVLGV